MARISIVVAGCFKDYVLILDNVEVSSDEGLRLARPSLKWRMH
jgi:hypothetical protein